MRRTSVTVLLLFACGPQVPVDTDGDTGIVSTTAADPSSTNDDGVDDSNDTEIIDYDFGGAWTSSWSSTTPTRWQTRRPR